MLQYFFKQNTHVYIKQYSFLLKINENTYTKGRALMPMQRVVPKTKRGSSLGVG